MYRTFVAVSLACMVALLALPFIYGMPTPAIADEQDERDDDNEQDDRDDRRERPVWIELKKDQIWLVHRRNIPASEVAKYGLKTDCPTIECPDPAVRPDPVGSPCAACLDDIRFTYTVPVGAVPLLQWSGYTSGNTLYFVPSYLGEPTIEPPTEPPPPPEPAPGPVDPLDQRAGQWAIDNCISCHTGEHRGKDHWQDSSIRRLVERFDGAKTHKEKGYEITLP
jgi:hypothetical protein